MVKFGLALTALLSTSTLTVDAFHNLKTRALDQNIASRQRAVNDVPRRVSSSSSSSEFNQNGESIGEAFNTVTNAARDSLANAVRDEPDTDEARIAQKQRQVKNRTKTYTVTLPLATSSVIEESKVLSMGMSIRQVNKGREFDDEELDLDSLEIRRAGAIGLNGEQMECLDESSLSRRMNGEFQGLVVSSLNKEGAAWAAGVRPGDIVKGTSATVGAQLWPKSTLEGVRSVIQSRKAASGSIQFELQRLGEAIDNQFELTLTRPIGLELKETEDGYVEVTGFTQNAPTLVQYAVKVGDRVLAVDSSMGDRMWPVSTVEGVVSAVTTRLPGKPITLRFERPSGVQVDSDQPIDIRQKVTVEAQGTAVAVPQDELLRRCREVIKRYSKENSLSNKFVNKYSVPGMVAEKVVDALASASASVDAITLSMIMNAYLSCRQAKKAIEVFEAATGIAANGLRMSASNVIRGKNDAALKENAEALDNYTASALLKAHAMSGDLASVRSVLVALGGPEDLMTEGVQVAPWPGTGVEGRVQPNTRCYNIAISALADSNAESSFELALRIFEMMPEPGRKTTDAPSRSLVTYNAMINALTTKGRFEEAIDLFYRMKRVGITPDKFSYTSLVKAIVAMSEGDVEEFFYDMKEQGVSPDPILFNTVIKSLCEQRKVSAAKKIIYQMESLGVLPDSMTYGLLMKGLIDTGNPSAALTLFETACSDRRTVALTENVYLYTTAISAAAAIADHERALGLLSRMNGLGISPNLKTMTALVGACLSSGMPDLAFDIYQRISTPDGYAMLQGIRALSGFGRAQHALNMLNSTEARILSGKQRMLAHKSLIEGSLEMGDFETAREVFSNILQSGNIPSKAIYETIYETLSLFPKKTAGGITPVIHFDEDSNSRFQFLLFVLDSVISRNLPCEGPLYSAILVYGSSLGNLPRKLSSLLVAVRSSEDVGGKKMIDNSDSRHPNALPSWEELYRRYDEMKDAVMDDPSMLPKLAVRVNSRDVVKVLRAEKGLSYTKRKPRRQEV